MLKNFFFALLSSIFVVLFVIFLVKPVYAANNLPSSYYPYNNTFADGYIGVGFSSIADVSTDTSSNPNWGALYNPLQLLKNYGFDLIIGLRPLNKIPILRGFRVEAAQQYRESRYKLLIDSNKSSWMDKTKIPKLGRLFVRDAYLVNFYYDFRWFSEVFYPYVGVGMGIGEVGAQALDYNMLPSGVGEEYHGYKCNVRLNQFMAGVEYDTKIIKSSLFIQYSYEQSGKFLITNTYKGDEDGGDKKDDPNPLPHDYKEPQPKEIAFKAHTIMFGIKFYLF